MVVKPQKTKFQIKIVENIQTLSIWASNPWRRYSISLITLLIGYFFGSSLGMVSAVVELMDPVAAFLSVVFIEFLIVLRRNFRFERKRKFLVLTLDSLRLDFMVSLLKVLSCYKFTCCVFVIDKAKPFL